MVALKMSLIFVCALIAVASALPAAQEEKQVVVTNAKLEAAADYLAALFDEPLSLTEDSEVELSRGKRACHEAEVKSRKGRTLTVRRC